MPGTSISFLTKVQVRSALPRPNYRKRAERSTGLGRRATCLAKAYTQAKSARDTQKVRGGGCHWNGDVCCGELSASRSCLSGSKPCSVLTAELLWSAVILSRCCWAFSTSSPLQVLHCESEVALVDGLNNDAPLGTCISFMNHGNG